MKIPAGLEVCVVDPDPVLYNTLLPMFHAAGAQLCWYGSAAEVLESELLCTADCLVVAARLPDRSGLELILELRARKYAVPVMLLVPADDVGTAVSAMRSGAADVLETPVSVSRLLHSVVSTVGAA